MFKHNTVTKMASLGNMAVRAFFSSTNLGCIQHVPQLNCGGCTPKPRKLTADSVKMAPATAKLACYDLTGHIGQQMGKNNTPVRITEQAASTNSLSFKQNRPHHPGIHQPVRPAELQYPGCGFKNGCDYDQEKQLAGRKISTRRINITSIMPPK